MFLSSAQVRRCAHIFRLLAFSLLTLATFCHADSGVTDDGVERAHLATIIRQLEQIQRQAERLSEQPPLESPRYHFDYSRLQDDLRRIRAGVQDYLSPQRAQPRDSNPMNQQYRIEAATSAGPASAPQREARKP